MSDWSSPHRVPQGYAHEARKAGNPTPEGVQANLFTLARIGGVYDILAAVVEKRHLSILTPWRLDSEAPSVVDYIEARDSGSKGHNPNA